MTHGDDVVVTGPTERLTECKNEMTGVYPIRTKLISYGSTESIKALNRGLHWRKRGIVYQHNPRHVDVLVKDLRLEQGNSVQTPSTHDVTEEEPEPLDQVEHSKTGRKLQHVFSCLAHNIHRERVMSKDVTPHATEPCQVAKVWSNIRNPRDNGGKKNGRRSDNNFSGCKGTRASSSAGVILLDSHTLKADTCKQHIIARSSAEAELYAEALGASESKGIVSLLKDLGYENKPVLASDAKATSYMWMQNEVRSKRFMSEENVADLVTKPLSKAVIAKHCLGVGNHNMAEENGQRKLQDVAMYWHFGSIHLLVTGGQDSQQASHSR